MLQYFFFILLQNDEWQIITWDHDVGVREYLYCNDWEPAEGISENNEEKTLGKSSVITGGSCTLSSFLQKNNKSKVQVSKLKLDIKKKKNK